MSKQAGFHTRGEGNLYLSGYRGSVCAITPTPSIGVRQSYQQMHQRCYNQKRPHYPRYGGRGIYVVDHWHSFINFFHDMGEKPEGLTLERIQNDGPYGPDNCVWATARTQAQNREKTNWVNFQGERRCLADLSREFGIGLSVLSNRIVRLGWTVEKSVTTPVQG